MKSEQEDEVDMVLVVVEEAAVGRVLGLRLKMEETCSSFFRSKR